jgi:hypothetical protein
MKRLFLVLTLCSGAWAAEQIVEVENKSYWLCKNKKDVRTIRVHVGQGGICSTLYSKGGTEKVVGSGKNHESCSHFLENIKDNLEKSNWVCRDITSTRITTNSSE